MRYAVSIIFFLISLNGIAQEPSKSLSNFADKDYYLIDSLALEELSAGDKKLIDSCLTVFHNDKNEANQIKAIEFIVEECWDRNVWPKYNNWLYDFILLKMKTSSSPTLKKSLANAINNIGFLYSSDGQFNKAVSYYKKGLKIREEIGDEKGISNSLNNIGYLFETHGQVKEALAYYSKSLKIQEKIGDKKGMGNSLNNIAEIYRNQSQLDEALKYHLLGLKKREEIDDKYGIAVSNNNIGLILKNQGEYDEALIYYQKGLQLREEIGDKKGIANSLINIGAVYNIQGNIEEALNYDIQSLNAAKEVNDMEGVGLALNNIAYIYERQGNTNIALEYGLESYKISKEIGIPWNIKYAANLLSDIYEKQQKGMQALEMYKLYVLMKDSINNEETQKASIRQQTQYEFEKEQIRKENEAKEQARIEAAVTKRRNNLQYSLIFLGILLLFGVVLSLGFIKVSPNVAEGLIFFAFLILFEFILVFTDPYLQELTHDEPMYNLAANAIIALLIFPLHAVLERLLKKRIVVK